MPYKKRSSIKKRPSSWYNKKYSVGEIAQKALSGVARLKQLVNVEHKLFDTYNTGNIAITTGTQIPLSIVIQGDTFANRQGNSIKATSFEYRIRLQQVNTAIAQGVRVIFLQDRTFNPVATIIGDVLEDGPGTVLGLMVAPEKHTNIHRFHILSDRTYELVSQTAATYETKYITGYLPIKNHLHYSDTNPNTAINTREGQIYVWIITDATTDLPRYDLYSRLNFVDN